MTTNNKVARADPIEDAMDMAMAHCPLADGRPVLTEAECRVMLTNAIGSYLLALQEDLNLSWRPRRDD
jgi:hypothetical protein